MEIQFRKPIKPLQKNESDECKIKIRKTAKGSEISFSGKCSRDQIDVAKSNILDREND